MREPCLSQIDWAPRFASLCIAQLVKYVAHHPRGIAPDYMHLIGYSVGAHLAGLVANYITPSEGKLGRITGLDPTIFVYSGTNNSRDLDPSDVRKRQEKNFLRIILIFRRILWTFFIVRQEF